MMMQFPENPDLENREKGPDDRKKFTYIGFGLLTAFVLMVAAEYLIVTFLQGSGFSPRMKYLCVDVAMCILAFPAGAFLIGKAGKSQSPLGERKGFAVTLALLAVATEFGIAGQLLGSFFAGSDSGGEWTAFGSVTETLLYLLVMVLVEPVCEELFFRKCLSDVLRQWGWKTAVLCGALFYALFHANVGQFFMALGLGVIYTYAYLTTGKIRVPVFLHMFVNFFFQAVPLLSETYLCSTETLTAVEEAMTVWAQSGYAEYTGLAELLQANSGAVAAMLVQSLVSMLELGLSLAGAVLLFTMSRKVTMKPGERVLDRKSIGDTVFMAPGVILFVICSIVFAVLSVML